MSDKPYRDPETLNIEDWKWHPMEHIERQLSARRELPEHVLPYAEYMQHMADRAQHGGISPRDLIKAHTITQSSIGRGGLSHATATKRGMHLPNTGGEVRPEGAFSEWLGSPMGQHFLDAAERGDVHPEAMEDIRTKFAPFGKQNAQVDAMRYAAENMPGMAEHANRALTGSKEEYRDFAKGIKGIAGAKSGFIGSLLGRGDQPTLDARQLNLHSLSHPTKAPESMMSRGRGAGGQEAVDRLSARHDALGYDIPHELLPHAQHLIHHDIWDQLGGTQTTHEDLIRAMRGYAAGGDVHPHVEQMARELAEHHAKGGEAYKYPQDDALEQARLNAIRLLGLHEHNTPHERARAMGFNTAPSKETYHGARGELQGEIDPSRSDLGFHTGTIEQATNRLKSRAMQGQDYPEGANTLPLLMSKYANMLKLKDEGSFHADAIASQLAKKKMISREKALQIMQDIGDDHKKQNFYDEQMRRVLEQHGYHGGQYSNEQEGQGKSMVFTDPSQLRSRFAAFDPARAHEAGLNYAAGGDVHPHVEQMARELADKARTEGHQQLLTRMARGVPDDVTDSAFGASGYAYHTPHRPIENSQEKAIGERVTPIHERAFTTERPLAAHKLNQIEAVPVSSDAVRHFAKEMHDAGVTGMMHKDSKRFSAVMPSSKNEGHHQATYFDNQGAISDTQHADPVDAIHHLLDSGYTKILPEHRLGSLIQKTMMGMKLAHGGSVEPSHDDMLAHIMLHKADGGSIRHEPTNVGVDEAPGMVVKRYMPAGVSDGRGNIPVGGVDLNQGQPGQQFAPEQPPQGMPPQGAPGQPPAGMPPTGPQAPAGPPSNILNMTRQGQAMSAMKAPVPAPMAPAPAQMAKPVAPPNPSPLIKNGMARMAKGGSAKPVVRGIIKEQVTVIPDLAAMKRALMKAKR
jgi:hypothetical protein